ncbi:MAG: hypothetical protein PVG19_02435 [Desulfobacterales bacterium]|jgi:hypothetical protein
MNVIVKRLARVEKKQTVVTNFGARSNSLAMIIDGHEIEGCHGNGRRAHLEADDGHAEIADIAQKRDGDRKDKVRMANGIRPWFSINPAELARGRTEMAGSSSRPGKSAGPPPPRGSSHA